MHYQIAVFIGRFQPFHLAHKRVIQEALTIADSVLILVGSVNQPRTPKNPFNFEEREYMIHESLDPQDLSRCWIKPVEDQPYNDQRWIGQIQRLVKEAHASHKKVYSGSHPDEPAVVIVGYEKDASSYYLNLFPNWDYEEIEPLYDHLIDATKLREHWYAGGYSYIKGAVTDYVYRYLMNKKSMAIRDAMNKEYEFILSYRKQWAAAPYPPVFVTTDAVVVQSGHIILGQRRAAPGEGLYALPGGFLGTDERIEDSMIRELQEETRIKVPVPVLRGSIMATHVFDAPDRSLRGRTITHAFHILLPDGPLPKIRGSDDMKAARWVPLSELKGLKNMMFEDHSAIIEHFLGGE